MSPTQIATSYVPSVRGDAMLLTHGRTGTAADLLLVSAAVVLDGALGGHIDVVGRKLLGFERRRVVPGLERSDAPPLMAELRLLAASPDDLWGWFDRAAGFALERVSVELEEAGVITPLRLSRTRRFLRHDTLIVSERAEAAARGRVHEALDGAGTPEAIALGAVLDACGLLTEATGRREARRLAVRTLPNAAQAFLGVLGDQRRREALIGTE